MVQLRFLPPLADAVGARHEVTAQIPANASLIRFGVFPNGGGQLELRHPGVADARGSH